MKNQYFYLLIALISSVGCVNTEYKPDVVSRSDAQKQSYVIIGNIRDINKVTIEGDRAVGAAAGALIGGVAGKGVTDSDTESDIALLVETLLLCPIAIIAFLYLVKMNLHIFSLNEIFLPCLLLDSV